MSKPPGGSKYTSAYGWSTNPKAVWTAAKAKALSCLDEDNPKLTVLELAFWRRLKGTVSATDREHWQGAKRLAD